MSLFSPIKLRDLVIKNRIWVSPMCQYSCKDGTGVPTDWHLVHLGSRAVGGSGLIIAEATGVSPEGRISPWDTGIWGTEHVAAWKRITSFIAAQGCVPAIQLAHAGRKASTAAPWLGGKAVPAGGVDEGKGVGWTPVAPSPVPFYPGEPAPAELTREQIRKVVADFVSATHNALAAGFQVVELHYAHGYLIHEFLSPFANKRTDDYGGSFDNRIRLALEIAQAVRDTWPSHLPVLVRISATDWEEGGWDGDQSVELCRRLKAIGIDLIDTSTGGAIPHAKIPVGPGFQVPFAERIRKEAGIPSGAVGFITNATQAEEIVSSGKADVVLMARELLRDPYFPLHAAQELGTDVRWPDQYARAKPT